MTSIDVDTPWGSSARLRERRLPPGRGGNPENRERNQRERLYGATVAAVAARGYAETSVADLIELAGVSRSTFYQHFADKRACFLATYDAIVETALVASSGELDTPGPGLDRLAAAYSKLLKLIAAYPTAAHLCLVDIYAAGPAAREANDHTTSRFELLLRHALGESPEHRELPPVVVQAILGGNFKLLTSRVRRGLAAELPDVVADFSRWALSYQALPGAIAKPRPRPPEAGGPQFAPYGDAGRIYEALASEIAERGYQATTIEGIATRAKASTHTFYKHFESKESAFVAAYDAGLSQSFALVRPAFEQGVDWPDGLRAALRALLHFLAADPDWTRAAILESPAAGALMMQRSDDAIDTFATLVRPGLDHAPQLGEVAVEATAGAIYALIYDHVRKPGPARLLELLPACTYVGLAPFIGAEQALAVANHGARSGRPGPRSSR